MTAYPANPSKRDVVKAWYHIFANWLSTATTLTLGYQSPKLSMMEGMRKNESQSMLAAVVVN
eukprot:3549577-Amphidinium_carterae.1